MPRSARRSASSPSAAAPSSTRPCRCCGASGQARRSATTAPPARSATSRCPLPVQQPLEVWLGGTVPAALERCGRLSDGWLPSLCTPAEAAAGRGAIEEAAARAGRSISPEHFGVSIGYASRPIDPATARTMAARRPRALELTPVGWPALREFVGEFIAVGVAKVVVRLAFAPASWRSELEALASAVGDLQT